MNDEQVEQDVKSEIWAFETPEWEAIKKDVESLASTIKMVFHSSAYVWRLRMACSDLYSTVKRLRAELEETNKKIVELEAEIEESRESFR